jgi:hypothetical protein
LFPKEVVRQKPIHSSRFNRQGLVKVKHVVNGFSAITLTIRFVQQTIQRKIFLVGQFCPIAQLPQAAFA